MLPKYIYLGNIPGVKYKIIKDGNKVYKFAQNFQGLMPKILIHLLNSRGLAKKDMKEGIMIYIYISFIPFY